MVEGESGNSALSLEGVMDTGLAPAADAIATEIEVEVTGTRTCSRFSLMDP